MLQELRVLVGLPPVLQELRVLVGLPPVLPELLVRVEPLVLAGLLPLLRGLL